MPLTDTTRDELAEIMARYPQPRSALLPMLHLVQAEEGFVTPAGIDMCAELLDLSAAEVAAVATFYTMYKRRPIGDYHVGVCTNTLCAVMGGDTIFSALKEHLEVGNDETTADGKVTLEHIECNAACDFAPVLMVNWEFVDNATVESARQLVDDLRAGREVRSTRGPVVQPFRAVERVLAGFPDGLAAEGPSAGPATLAGLEIARERGDVAPAYGSADSEATESEQASSAAEQQQAHNPSSHDSPASTAAEPDAAAPAAGPDPAVDPNVDPEPRED